MKDVNQITNLEELMKQWLESECWKRGEKKAKNGKISLKGENTIEENKEETYEVGSIFVEDGIINSKLFNKQAKRVLFILKEAYVVPEERKSNHSSLLEDFYKDGVVRNFWNRIAEWSAGILNTTSKNILSIDDIKNNKEAKSNAIEKIALINLKKSDGKKRTNMNKFEKYFFPSKQDENENMIINRYKGYLIRQIELINPDIIICCGTFNVFKKIINERNDILITKTKLERVFNLKKVENGLNAILINYYHPSYRIPLDLLYYGLISTYQEILKS